MSAAAELDWRQLPLTGTALIEASAGTGKTYNIALLYLRLVLERGLEARQLLVTTFTDAAAQELRARIRLRLLDAEATLTGAAAADPTLQGFLDELADRDGRARVLTRVRLALSDLDLAPISTIHGFCRRVLTDFPFDTGVPFTLGDIVDEPTLVRECVADFWRSRFLIDRIDPWDRAYVADQGMDGLAQIVGDILNVDDAAIDLAPTNALRDWWAVFCQQDHREFAALLATDAAFKDAKRSALRKALRGLVDATVSGDMTAVEWDKLATDLQPETVEKRGAAGFTPKLSSWPEVCALVDVRHLFANVRYRILHEAARDGARFVRAQLRSRLQARGQTTFTQLIDEVHDRLLGAGGAALAARLQQAWPVALIDEFQDTDARQWAIFDRVWRGAGRADRGLILIGDPKQSIYGFRGGDVHNYLAVRQQLEPQQLHSISRNFRSQPRLLTALNQLYDKAGTLSFGHSGIDYIQVEAGDPARWADEQTDQPLRLRLIGADSTRKADRDAMALERCANEIAAQLNDPRQGVRPGDIAVLVDANKRIKVLRALLIERGVPVVGAGRANVMQSDWAQDLQLLFHALLDPSDEYALRAALATRLLGRTASALIALSTEVADWEDELSWFARLQQRWRQLGPLAVIEALIESQAPRLLAAADGERALTDLRHLGELMQEAAAERYGPEELYAWFVSERARAGDGDDAGQERQLRIESESARVQLLTIHASKGMQYPIVYVPMAWRGRTTQNRGRARYHHPLHGLRLDLGSTELPAHQAQMALEDLQERLRHLYVALTRAERECVVYGFDDLLPTNTTESKLGALNLLLGAALHGTGQTGTRAWDALTGAIPTLALDRGETIGTRYQKPQTATSERVARHPLPSPRPYLGQYSFSVLTRLRPAATEAPRGAEDEWETAEAPYPDSLNTEAPHPALLALAPLRGPRFGDAIHDLLEDELSATTTPAAGFVGQGERIARALDRQSVRLPAGNDAPTLIALAELLDRTLTSELTPGLRLGTLPVSARRPEFEFTFALDEARWWQLHRLLDQHQLGDWWPRMQPAPALRGMMKGYIDLVFQWDGRFHVLDYKSNWLGECVSDYHQAGLDDAMVQHHYGLQALIYTVALHRYLAHRIADYDPARHLGDSWYVFVRAVGLAPAAGVWRQRFASTLIAGLDALFDGEELSACV